MLAWREAIQEFRRVLQRLGAFRDVRTWRLLTAPGPAGVLSLTPEGSRAARRRPGELSDPSGRRIILVASDCTTEAWRDGSVRDLLEAWGRTQPVALVQVLPPSLWLQTALGRSPEVLVFAPRVGAPNALLTEAQESPNDSLLPVPLPVIRLEPDPLAAWARMLTSPGASGSPALLFEPVPLINASAKVLARSGEERVRRFESFASKPAQELAALLAAVPLKPALLRMVQHTIARDARDAHLAEVLLGGLTRVTDTVRDPDPEALSLDFLPGVRDALLSRLTTVRAMSVFHAVSRYIADHFGESIDFLALLENPDGFVPVGPPGQDRPFARIASQYLRRLGGRYAQAADHLDRRRESQNTIHQNTFSHIDGYALARARIAEEKEKRTGFLDLGLLGLTQLPEELFELDHLWGLNLANRWQDHQGNRQEASLKMAPNQLGAFLSALHQFPGLIKLSISETNVADLSPLVHLQSLQSLDCSNTQISDLAPLALLQSLQSLDCSNTQVSDLAPLAELQSLRSLDCSNIQVSDLASLAELQSLRSLNCSNTQVSGLAFLTDLQPLHSLDCSSTPVSDLAPLAEAQSLQSLDCSNTQVSDLAPLAELESLQSLDCSNTQVSDLAPLANLQSLQSLNCSGTQVGDLASLADLWSLRSLDCSGTQIGDLASLAELQSLQSLDCSNTQVSDLAPLAELESLRSLDCSNTQVSDLAPLANLQSLQSFNCSGTQVGDLASLAELQSFQSLDCSNTQVSDLAPLAELESLRSLDCSNTQVSDLAPLANLQSLQSFNCSVTQVGDLAPLAEVESLRSLDCSDTQVSDLAPLAELESLQSLDCSNTQVSDLASLALLESLQSLDCSDTQVSDLPEALVWLISLKELYLFRTRITDIPAEILSPNSYTNCLENLRAHLRDLKAGAERLPDVKALVLGNGRIGKTQICRRLRGEAFEANADSTHGILVTSAVLPMSDSESKPGRPRRKKRKSNRSTRADEAALLHLWDFGGQDLYHGTHALFMRTRSVFIVVWTSRSEDTREYEYGGMTFRNHPLAYWLEYVRHLSGTHSPLLIVQNMCDRAEDELLRPPVQDQALQDFSFRKVLHYSALKDRGRGAFDETLRQAIQWLRENMGQARIGRGRLVVKRKLEALRDQDASLPVEKRKYRTLTQEFFHQLCTEVGDVSSPEMLLDYLHHAGIVFYRKGLFDDCIVLDQGWALEAVYAVFHQQKCYRQLRQLRGRFSRTLLEALVWQEYRVEEQELFLSMMTSSGVCFVHREGKRKVALETEYIAPDLLPDREDVATEIEWIWGEPAPGGEMVVELPFLHPGIMRGIISQVGQAAGISALYWKYGVCLYEKTTHSRALIEQRLSNRPDSWSGQIAVSTRGGQAAELLQWLQKSIKGVIERSGCRDWKFTATSKPLPSTHASNDGRPGSVEAGPIDVAAERKLEFIPMPSDKKTYCVSCAWNDESKAIVDGLCEEARQRGIEILRDKTGMGLDESISRFMQKLGAGDRVFVILSEKYLKSPYCMYELLEVWRNCKMEDEVYRQRIRVYRLPDAKMSSPLEACALRQALERAIQGAGCRRPRARRGFARSVGLQTIQTDAGLRPSRRGHARADRRHAPTGGLRGTQEARLRGLICRRLTRATIPDERVDAPRLNGCRTPERPRQREWL